MVVVDDTTLSPIESAITIDRAEISADTASLALGGTGSAFFTAAVGPSQTISKPIPSTVDETAVESAQSTTTSDESRSTRSLDTQAKRIALALALCGLGHAIF